MQGKSYKQYEEHGKFFLMAITGIFVLFVSLLAWNEFHGQDSLYNSLIENFASVLMK